MVRRAAAEGAGLSTRSAASFFFFFFPSKNCDLLPPSQRTLRSLWEFFRRKLNRIICAYEVETYWPVNKLELRHAVFPCLDVNNIHMHPFKITFNSYDIN